MDNIAKFKLCLLFSSKLLIRTNKCFNKFHYFKDICDEGNKPYQYFSMKAQFPNK